MALAPELNTHTNKRKKYTTCTLDYIVDDLPYRHGVLEKKKQENAFYSVETSGVSLRWLNVPRQASLGSDEEFRNLYASTCSSRPCLRNTSTIHRRLNKWKSFSVGQASVETVALLNVTARASLQGLYVAFSINWQDEMIMNDVNRPIWWQAIKILSFHWY